LSLCAASPSSFRGVYINTDLLGITHYFGHSRVIYYHLPSLKSRQIPSMTPSPKCFQQCAHITILLLFCRINSDGIHPREMLDAWPELPESEPEWAFWAVRKEKTRLFLLFFEAFNNASLSHLNSICRCVMTCLFLAEYLPTSIHTYIHTSELSLRLVSLYLISYSFTRANV